jgi:hypothetical protein
MLSRFTSVLIIVMVCLVFFLLSPVTENGVRVGKLFAPPHPLKTPSDAIDIDTEIMRRVQRIGSFTGTVFIKSEDIRRD